jgi:hypothetical protein
MPFKPTVVSLLAHQLMHEEITMTRHGGKKNRKDVYLGMILDYVPVLEFRTLSTGLYRPSRKFLIINK